MRFLIALIVGLLLGMFAREAEGGIFGRRCHSCVPSHSIPYAPPSTTTNIILNNLYPSTFPLQGSTLYGVQSAASSYGDSPSLFMDRSARFTEMALELAKTGTEGFNETGRLALELNDAADRRRHNAQVAALAMEANRGTTLQTLQIKIQDGVMSIVQPEAAEPPALALTVNRCAECHSGDKPKGGIVLDGSVPFDLQKAMTAVISGKMPPKANLTAAQKATLTAELCNLLNGGLK